MLNLPGYAGASILVAGRNFGSGSSREHAPWALLDYGFRCVIASSFADIFYSNCFQNGILPVTLPEEAVGRLIANAEERPGYDVTVDLDARRVQDSTGAVDETFEIDPFRRYSLMNGLDGSASPSSTRTRSRRTSPAGTRPCRTRRSPSCRSRRLGGCLWKTGVGRVQDACQQLAALVYLSAAA